jgi:dipeptidyl-peptidase-4
MYLRDTRLFQMPSRRITSRDVAAIPQPGFSLADSIHFSPDDNVLTYLRSPNQSLMRQLYAYDLRTNKEFIYAEPDDDNQMMEERLSIEEKLRREVGVFLLE